MPDMTKSPGFGKAKDETPLARLGAGLRSGLKAGADAFKADLAKQKEGRGGSKAEAAVPPKAEAAVPPKAARSVTLPVDTKPMRKSTMGPGKGGFDEQTIRGIVRNVASAGRSNKVAAARVSPTGPGKGQTAGVIKIKKGDTLSALARSSGKSVAELAKINNIKDPNKIYAGKTLRTK